MTPTQMTTSTPNKEYKILIAEDDPATQRLYQRLLEPFAKLIILSDGKQAQETLTHTQDYNLIITDNNMPLFGGLELLASLPKTITIPRVMISSTLDHIELHQEVQQHGALGLYQKPLNCINEFRTIVHELLKDGHSPTLHAYFEKNYN